MTRTQSKLVVSRRTLSGRKVKQLRSQNLIPGNIFGKKIASLSVQFDAREFKTVFAKAGESSLVYLSLGDEKDTRPTFISQVSLHPVTGEPYHVAFHQVDLKEKVTAPVPLVLVGESLAEKDKTGIMVQQLDEIEIEALPTDMPENIQIDVSALAQPGDNIKVADLKLDSTKLEIKIDPATIAVQIEALAKEEVAPPTPAAETPAATGEGAAVSAETPAPAPKAGSESKSAD